MGGEGKFIDGLMMGDVKVTGTIKDDNAKNYCLEKFRVQPICQVINATTANPSGTADTSNIARFDKQSFEYVAKGTQTIIGLGALAATGLSVGGDQTDNDGREINFGGGYITRPLRTYVVGTPFFARLKFSIATVAGTDDCAFGFRKVAAYGTNFDDYTDVASLNVISGNIYIETILNNATTTSTDTTQNWADGESHELRVDVDADGVATFMIDGAEPTVTASVTLDAGDSMIPFMFFLQANASQAGAIVLEEFESSYV
jgi:hypothetical protein